MKPLSKVPADLAWQLADQVGQLHSQWLALSDKELENQRISSAELIALSILESFPQGLTQTAWGYYQGVSRQRAHTLTKSLVNDRLVSIKKQGRESTIKLTRTGQASINQIRPAMSRKLAQEMHQLSRKDARELSRLLEKLLTPPSQEGKSDTQKP